MPNSYSQNLSKTEIIEDLPKDWSPALISLNLGICIYVAKGKKDHKLCMRLISQVVEALEEENREEPTFGVK